MLKHIVLNKFKPDVPRAEIDQIVEGLRALPARIDVIRSYEVAEDQVREARSFDLAIVGLFDDMETLKRYQVHPEHVAVATRLRAATQQQAIVDYQV